MNRRTAEWIELAMDAGAAALFAAAVGYVVHAALAAQMGVAIAGAAAAFALCFASLRRIQPAKPDFEALVEGERAQTPLTDLLAEGDRSLAKASPEELLLDDILSAIDPDSRVVRLFEPDAMPAPGQLKTQIARRRGNGSVTGQSSDASQVLYDALDELRRSLN